MWIGGGYSDEQSIDATAQNEAKARGMAQAIEDVLNKIDDLVSARDLEEEDETKD